jgi:hypothetical protein
MESGKAACRAKGSSKFAVADWNVRRSLVNTDAPWPTLEEAETRVLGIQTKLHQWAKSGPDRQFKDLYNLVYDPAVLLVAWHRVRGNRGARSAGVDGVQPRKLAPGSGLFLLRLHLELKSRTFQPMPVRQRMIPKTNGKLRGLGIPTARDRTVQAALKLILEPVFEASSSRAVMASVPTAGRWTRSPRSTSWVPAPMNGCSKVTSRRASTRSTIRP